MRVAIVDSIKSTSKYLFISGSDLDESSRGILERNAAQMWFVIIRLLEDDNDSIRESVAQIVSDVTSQRATDATPSHSLMVSRAITNSFDFLTKHYAHVECYHNYLLNTLLYETVENAGEYKEEREEEGIGKVSARALFDHEDTNAYHT